MSFPNEVMMKVRLFIYLSMIIVGHSIRPDLDENGLYRVTANPSKAIPMDKRPDLRLFVADGFVCIPCDQAKRELLKADADLPFKVIVSTEVPKYLKAHVTAFPAAYWIVDANDREAGGRVSVGWHSVARLVSAWENSFPKQKPVAVNASCVASAR